MRRRAFIRHLDLRPPRRAELETVVENDHALIYEGLGAKDKASAYRGGRTLSWLKVRQPGDGL